MPRYSYREGEGAKISGLEDSLQIIVKKISGETKKNREIELEVIDNGTEYKINLVGGAFFTFSENIFISVYPSKKRGRRVNIKYDMGERYRIRKL